MRHKMTACALGLLMLAGCQTTGPQATLALNLPATACSAQPDTTQAAPLTKNDKKVATENITMTMESPCLLTEDGRQSLYAVYALPDRLEPTLIHVTSPIPRNQDYVFAPSVHLLDGHGKTLRSLSKDDILPRGQRLSIMVRQRPEERFLVIASNPALVGTEVTRINQFTTEHTVYTGSTSFTLNSGLNETKSFAYSHTGNVILVLQPMVTEIKG